MELPVVDEKTDRILEKLGEAVIAIRDRDKNLEDIRQEQGRQAEVLQAIQQTLAHLEGSIEGSNHAAKISELEAKHESLEKDVLKPGGVVDNLRIDSAKRSERDRLWGVVGTVLGAAGTFIGILSALKVI